jgi:hypothetical protein
MKEIKVLSAVFLLTVAFSIVVLFLGSMLTGGSRINLFPAQDSGRGDVLGITFLLTSVIGGIAGAVIGILSVIFLAINMTVWRESELQLSKVLSYSFLIGCLSFLMFFLHIWDRNSTYSSLATDVGNEWIGLSICFTYGFLIAFLPVFVTRKLFAL